jgi:hypothetical protein
MPYKIAILGWGSLVWDPDSLKDHLEDSGKFEQRGPKLPLEFSRISEDGRLTLVIDKDHGPEVPTRVAISTRSALNDAVTDLWIREMRFHGARDDAEQRSKDGRIGYTDLLGENASVNLPKDQLNPDTGDHQFAHDLIMPWLQKSGFQAVVWTALPPKYKEKRVCDFSVDDAINYLDTLQGKSRENAFEYICKAPPEVETPVRKLFNDRLGGKRAGAPAAKNTETQSVAATRTPTRPTTESVEPAPARSETFTSAETEELKTQLEAELKRAAYWGRVNCAWDLTFKVVLLILGVVSATDAGLIATIWKAGSPPRWATIINIVVGVLIAALAGFATAQVNFSARTEIYRKKEVALQMMIDALKYLKPEKAVFFRALQEIYSWNDYTPATVQMPNIVFPGLDDERHNESSK